MFLPLLGIWATTSTVVPFVIVLSANTLIVTVKVKIKTILILVEDGSASYK